MSIKCKSSRMQDGEEICNTCVQPADKPYRYKTDKGERGCIATCHDKHIRVNANPNWVTRTRYILPKWITEARSKIPNFERGCL